MFAEHAPKRVGNFPQRGVGFHGVQDPGYEIVAAASALFECLNRRLAGAPVPARPDRAEVALVGFGKVIDQPWVENGMIGIRPVLTATIAGDHRATDGRTGAQFLDTLNKLLQEPEQLWT